jgi:adenylate cyclase
MAPRAERKLAAILAVDVVEYSRLVRADEAGTLGRVKAHRVEFAEPLIAEYRGRLVKLTGDGVLVEFESAVDAVECAVAIQKGMAEREAAVPEDRRIRYRIGINIGDIVQDDGDIFGDGVNIAVRLEGLAEPGGICIARNVYNQVKGKLDLAFEPMGEHKVKNIAEPVVVYRVVTDPGLVAKTLGLKRVGTPDWRWAAGAAVIAAIVAGSWAAAQFQPWTWLDPTFSSPSPTAQVELSAPLKLPSKPSIAVLPFVNMSGEERFERLADGITEDIITDLARFPDFMVIARDSTFAYRDRGTDPREIGRALGARYLVDGSFQAADGEIRVTAGLIDTTTGAHLWANRWKRGETRLFEMQDAVVQQIAGALGNWSGEIPRAERRRVARTPPASLEAYELYLLGRDHEEEQTQKDTEKAIGLLERSLALDPSFARAWLVLSYAHSHFGMFQWGSDIEASSHSQARREAILKAAELDPDDALVQIEFGDMRFRDGDVAGAKASYERALQLGRNTADVAALLAKYVAGILGRPAEALSLLDYAHQLNPYAPSLYWSNELRVCYLTGDYDRGLQAARRSKTNEITLLFKGLSLLELGRLAEAREVAVQLRTRYSDFKPRDVLNQAWINHPNAIARFSRDVERIGF